MTRCQAMTLSYPRSLVLVGVVIVAVGASACRERPIVGLHCEGGVRDNGSRQKGLDRYESLGGDCLYVSPDKPDTDPTTVGTATWVGTVEKYTVRQSAKDRFTLHADGKTVGTITREDHWIHVVFTSAVPKVSPGMRPVTPNESYGMRDDVPGPFI